ncbi:hypothetical protein ACFYYN_00425 [Streptomyces sp. NPDC001902]|nr:hypothetical protein [Streptomyces sp. PA03-1a]MDX2704112.1 hypothetical protein [Streptomyces sp. PA03-6a]MDX2818339.1 hypothetical protein [Streptomyces sp. PA03-5A]
MAQAVRPTTGSRLYQRILSTLNSDGRPHPVENTLAVATVVLGLISSIAAFWSGLHLLSSWAGLVGILVGAVGQYRSATTAERFFFIIGMGLAAVGFYIGMAHGGLFGGVVS